MCVTVSMELFRVRIILLLRFMVFGELHYLLLCPFPKKKNPQKPDIFMLYNALKDFFSYPSFFGA